METLRCNLFSVKLKYVCTSWKGGCQAKQPVGSLISMFSETESSDVWHVSMQMELLLNLTLARNFYISA